MRFGKGSTVIVQDRKSVYVPPPRRSSLARRETLWGLAFLSPWLIGLVVFTALPIVASLVLSFTNFNILHPETIKFIGLDNYRRMWNEFVGNGAVGQSLGVTARFALMSVPLGIGLALGLALLLNQKLLAAKPVFRTLFFMPVLIPLVASTIVWQGFLNGSTGWLAQILHAVGLPAPNWFADPTWALPGLVLLGIWGIGNMMLIFLAGLQSVPTELYEAVKVDGGGVWARFRHVTVPMISPVLFYNILIAIIGVSQYFTQAYVIDPGGNGRPGGSTLFFNMNLYNEGWSYNNMGYASALAWLMLIVVVIAALVLFRTSARWVFYAGGDK
jgi:multiple sugar transport system permease protein